MQNDINLAITIFLFALDFVIRVAAIIIVPRNRRPSSALGWLLAIFLIPYIGVILFLLIGSPRLGRKRRRRQAEINQFIIDSTEGIDKVAHSASWPAWLDSIVELNRNLGAMPLVGGNTAHMQIDYEKTMLDIAADIDKAKTFVHVEFYILSSDPVTEPVFKAMQHAVARGVEVRVLFDHVAAMRTVGYKATKKRLTAIGVDWHLMLPFLPLQGKYERPDLRNHRKLVIIDGVVGWMGSQNLIDSSYLKKSNIKRGLHWKDAMVRLQGPIVAGLNAIFITDWYSETDVLLTREAEPIEAFHEKDTLDCQIVPSGPGFASENNLRLFLALMYSAQEKIIITSPYFVPDESLMYAITSACQRGVRVELFVSEIGDQALVYHAQRSYYEALLRAGVVIWLYKAPTILHSKHMSIDDEVAVIGSSNMDMRSFSLNLEVSLMVRGESFVQQMREVEEAYRQDSRALTLDEWEKQPLRSTVLDGLARLTSSLQ
ncbi:cardiolipin synthase [Aurantimicrobium minutum]|uniref:cardiolipin synthase n=1 Tax=Aurantimicrobium minutum TaxID=708131 RepID=UPI0024751568|nr:cardiolipin synthase [Aurantimicrobium minutum]MDH6532253.1 cardiolipin synthase [Aurantimicrobium minutum]